VYLEKPLRDFIKDTSSRTPTPGGGSVAALVGALGSSLLAMVANFTLNNEKFQSVESEVKKLLSEIDHYTSRFCELIEEDISAYREFSHALSLPKTTPQEKEVRRKTLQLTLKKAAQVPLITCECCLKILNIASRLAVIGNPNLISDVGVGALLAQASLESAVLNVEINLSSIKDLEFVEEKRKAVQDILNQGRRIRDQLLDEVKRKITS